MACVRLGTVIEKARGTAAICHPLQKKKTKTKNKSEVYK